MIHRDIKPENVATAALGRTHPIPAPARVWRARPAAKGAAGRLTARLSRWQLLLTSDEPDADIKIADFGWSAVTKNKRATFCGTLDYIAPEMLVDGCANTAFPAASRLRPSPLSRASPLHVPPDP